MKINIITFLGVILLSANLLGDEKINNDQLNYKEALEFYSSGEFERAKEKIERIPEEILNQSADLHLIKALIEKSLGNDRQCIEILDRGWRRGHEELICPLALYHFEAKNYEWLRLNETKIMRAIANKVDNYPLAIKALYSLGVELRDIETLKNVMSQVTDEEIIKYKDLAKIMLDMHEKLLKAAADSPKQENKTEDHEKRKVD